MYLHVAFCETRYLGHNCELFRLSKGEPGSPIHTKETRWFVREVFLVTEKHVSLYDTSDHRHRSVI